MSFLHSRAVGVQTWPQAIAHCDADSFYLSCELLRHPELRGKPAVVTGKLGGIILSKSYDLKAKGIKTGMPIWEAKKLCPGIQIIPCDFPLYNDLSAKLFGILRQWTPDVEISSVDEAFCDLKGLRALYRRDYGQIAEAIKEDIKQRLGITVSMGVSVSKTLAKIAAEINKPDGVTVISSKQIRTWLPKFHVSEVPGFGRNTVPLLEKFGIHTCADFVSLTEATVRSLLHRPGLNLWKELQGEQVFQIQQTFAPNKLITRTSSFEPMTADQSFLWAHTVHQLERALEGLQEDHQLAGEITLYLRDRDFMHYSFSERLPSSTKSFSVLLEALKRIWKGHFPRNLAFRSTGITLTRLALDTGTQFTLFEDPGRIIRRDHLEETKQCIRDRYGRHSIRAASSLRLEKLGPDRKKEWRGKVFNVEW